MWKYDVNRDEKLELKRGNVVGTQTRTQNIVESRTRGNFEQLRINILDTLQQELTKYFSEDDLYKAFDILHPKYFHEG